MKFNLAFLFVFLSGLPVLGNSVNVACYPDTAPPAPPVYGGFPPLAPPPSLYASCSGLGSGGATATASAQAYFSLSATGNYNTLTLSASADASFSLFGGARSASRADFAEYFQTAGPVRAGYLQVSPSGGSGDVNGFGTNGLDISIPSGSSLYPPVLTGGGSSSNFPYRLYVNPVPTVLGVQFLLSGVASASAYADSNDGHGSGSTSANYSFRFFEADGVTPVVVSEAPEPSLILLVGLLLGGSALLRHRRESSSRTSKCRQQTM